jgi:hypothetical protein
VQLREGSAADPDLVLSATPHVIMGVLAGELDLAQARARGLDAEGDEELLKRVIPAAAARSA